MGQTSFWTGTPTSKPYSVQLPSCGPSVTADYTDLTVGDVCTAPTNAVVGLRAERVRATGLGLKADPVAPPPPANVAHALIVQNGLPRQSRRAAFAVLARQAEWVLRPR